MLNPGYYTNISFDDYLRWDALSATLLREFKKSPAHYQQVLKEPKEQTDSMLFGTLVHMMALDPDKVNDHFAIIPNVNYSLSENKAKKKAISEVNPGKHLIKENIFNNAIQMCTNLRTHSKVAQYLRDAETEVSILWDIESLLCKGRLDAYNKTKGIIVDLKTTSSAHPYDFSKTIINRGYHYQAAWYREGLRKLGLEANHFLLIAMENVPPFGIKPYELEEAVMDKAIADINQQLDAFRKCKETNIWPGYSDEIEMIGLPSWAEEKTINT